MAVPRRGALAGGGTRRPRLGDAGGVSRDGDAHQSAVIIHLRGSGSAGGPLAGFRPGVSSRQASGSSAAAGKVLWPSDQWFTHEQTPHA